MAPREPADLWVPCDLGIDAPHGPTLEEPEALAILDNWGQARKYLLSAKLGRGYHKPKPPSSSGRPSKGATNHKQRGRGQSFAGTKKKTVTRKSRLKTRNLLSGP